MIKRQLEQSLTQLHRPMERLLPCTVHVTCGHKAMAAPTDTTTAGDTSDMLLNMAMAPRLTNTSVSMTARSSRQGTLTVVAARQALTRISNHQQQMNHPLMIRNRSPRKGKILKMCKLLRKLNSQAKSQLG